MSLLIGLTLGVGLLLVVSAIAWPGARDATGSAHGRGSRVYATLAHAGIPQVTLSTVILVSIIVGLVGGAVLFALVPIAAVAIAAALALAVVPWVVISLRARSRSAAARSLWPDVVDQLVSSVRAGQSLPDAIAGLATTGPELAREPFAQFAREYATTGNFGLCATELKDRIADPVADRIIETLRMSREVGGTELTLVLRNLAAWLRQEAAIRSEVEARQSWVVNAARLGVAAPWVVLLLLSSRPEAVAAYNTAAGTALIIGGLVVSVFAYRVMRAIGRIRPEQRWFQ
jgi:tight adherence protein B